VTEKSVAAIQGSRLTILGSRLRHHAAHVKSLFAQIARLLVKLTCQIDSAAARTFVSNKGPAQVK
jgi:hypothetical protein